MKILLTALLVFSSLSAFADTDDGDKYTLPGKIGRISQSLGLAEIVGMTAYADTDNDPNTAAVAVKAMLDMNTDGYGNDISMMTYDMLSGVREGKLSVGLVYVTDYGTGVEKTQECLGADFELTDPETTPAKTCYKVHFKDIVFK
jgi:hypothetical protein